MVEGAKHATSDVTLGTSGTLTTVHCTDGLPHHATCPLCSVTLNRLFGMGDQGKPRRAIAELLRCSCPLANPRTPTDETEKPTGQ